MYTYIHIHISSHRGYGGGRQAGPGLGGFRDAGDQYGSSITIV